MDKWILYIPQWIGSLTFSYNMIHFLLVIALLVSGILLCLMGYKYLRVLAVIALTTLSGALGLPGICDVFPNTIVRMVIFVTFMFVSAYLFYVMSKYTILFLKRLRLYDALTKMQYGIAAAAGAAIIACTTYLCIYRSILTAFFLFAIFFAVSGLWGKKKTAQRKPSYTYEDLYRCRP